ncbi:hypothetical protein ACQZ5G_09825 [Agrobacterium sp. 22-214-1]
MRKFAQIDKSAIIQVVRALKIATVLPLILSGTPAFAGPVETGFFNATIPYVVLKRGSVECGKPDGDHIAYKQRLLMMLARIPNADLIVADRQMERAFEFEVMKYNPTCSDALLERYEYTMTEGAERSLKSFSDTVTDQLYKR